MRVAHIITDLDTGGAEIMLYKLLVSMHNLKRLNYCLNCKETILFIHRY